MNTPCPCHPDRSYAACCGPLHAGERVADSAEALMRSRYSAYVKSDTAYLLASWHPGTRPDTLDLDPGVNWLGLTVKRHHREDEDRAVVEFVARCRMGGKPALRLHEVSRFRRIEGRWYYLDGEFPVR